MADEVLLEIRRVARDELGLTTVPEPRHDLLVDLQLDSVSLLTLAVALEDRFRVRLHDEDAARVRTVGELVQLVEGRRDEARAPDR